MERATRPIATLVAVLVLLVAGCGGEDDSGYTESDIRSALGLRNERHEVLYEMAPGKDCVVIRLLTSSDQVEAAQREAGNVPTALAVNSNEDAGVIFAGSGAFSQDECVAPAESDLNSLSE